LSDRIERIAEGILSPMEIQGAGTPARAGR